MPPKFSLQSVMDYRHSQVEALEIELGRLLAVQRESQARLDSLGSLHNHLCGQLQQIQSGDLDLFLVKSLHGNINQVREAIVQATFDLRELEQLVETKRQQVISSRQSEETLGILKSKETDRFKADQARQELILQDDVYITRASRMRHA
ncbi:MAG: flagellar FliJ family protein [Anaerolineaceae bacterium]|nr:flagellar FliJ family protein [Anaerolineaceae bacterium]